MKKIEDCSTNELIELIYFLLAELDIVCYGLSKEIIEYINIKLGIEL